MKELTPARSYDIWDLGEFDQKGEKRTNWGTKEQLVDAIKKAADKGIITYIDAVMNHKYVDLLPHKLTPCPHLFIDCSHKGTELRTSGPAQTIKKSLKLRWWIRAIG